LLLKKSSKTNPLKKYIKILLENGWPLRYAVINGQYKITKLLIKKGANVNSKQSDNSTPLHLAIYSPNHEIIKLLVEKGASLDIKNNYGFTPLDIAIENQRIQENEIVQEKDLDELMKIELYLRTILRKR
jgi:hypothetical protein